MANGHTPGPWAVKSGKVAGPSGATVANVPLSPMANYEKQAADTRLIAAAPDMLAALREIAELTDGLGGTCLACRHVALEAIAKAEGK